MMRYQVNVKNGKRDSYTVVNTITGETICGTYTNFMSANHIVMCLNMYEELKYFELLSETLQKLDNAGR
jgi:hypothetical protein